MEELKVIYDRVTFLRQKGVKMKDIAERAGMTSSVLSAIYSTVLPAFFKNAEKGMEADEALSQALVWVNNVSKKRFLGSLAALKAAVFAPELVCQPAGDGAACPFLTQMEANLSATLGRIMNVSGTYMSYSLS